MFFGAPVQEYNTIATAEMNKVSGWKKGRREREGWRGKEGGIEREGGWEGRLYDMMM